MSFPNRTDLHNSLCNIIRSFGKPMDRKEMVDAIIDEYMLLDEEEYGELYRKLYTSISYELTELEKDSLISNRGRGLWGVPSR